MRVLRGILLCVALLAGSFTAVRAASPVVINANIIPAPVPTPNSSSTIIGFGDSTTYGAYGPTSCVSAQNQPTSVAAASLTGNCWLDKIGAFYGAHVINLGVGGTLLLSGSGSGISRYNAPYTCPAQSASPTSGLPNNCNPGTIPALDSIVGSNTFVYFAYNGINDACCGTGPNNSNYPQFFSNVQTIVNDLIAHGQPANQIVFIGAPRGNTANGANFNGFAINYLPYTAALGQEAINVGASFVDLWNGVANQTNPSSYYYDSTHFNNSGHALQAQLIESVNGLSALAYAGAYAVLGALYNNGGAPQFDTSGGNLTLPFGVSFNVQNTTISNTGTISTKGNFNFNGTLPQWLQVGGNNAFGGDGGQTLVRACCANNAIYFQTSTGANIAHLNTSGLIIDTLGSITAPNGIQPNGTGGGFSSETFPLGVRSTHPQTVSGTCASVAPTGTVCAFPNSFAFADATYTCRITPEGPAPAYISYDTKATTSFKAYSNAGTPTIDYECTR